MLRLALAPLLAAIVCTAGGPREPAPAPTPDEAPTSPPAAATTDSPRGVASAATSASPPAPDPIALDTRDACPEEPETPNGYLDDDGCPDHLPDDLAAITGVLDGVTFDLEKDTIRPASRPVLDHLVEVLTRYPDVEIEIQVHSDPERDEAIRSRCLTCRRAKAIAHYLINNGIESARVRHQGYGSERPLASNSTPAGRRQNRRVEIILLGPGGRPLPPEARPAAATCVDRRTLRAADGSTTNCYPYACRDGACLRRCASMTECGGAHHPGELAREGWPLECMPSGECTPMPPEKVH